MLDRPPTRRHQPLLRPRTLSDGRGLAGLRAAPVRFSSSSPVSNWPLVWQTAINHARYGLLSSRISRYDALR
jgi:hypothetical protein